MNEAPPAHEDDPAGGSGGDRPGGGLIAIAAATLIALAGLYFVHAKSEVDLANLALGEETIPVYGSYAGDVIHCEAVADAADCLAPAARRGLSKTVLWLGNSQLFAINQFVEGERTAPVIAAERLRPEGVEMLGFSIANANLVEHMLIYRWLAEQRKIDVLVLPVVFDDTRDLRVRQQVALALDDPAVAADIERSAVGAEILALLPPPPEEPERGTLQQRSEAAINAALEQCCEMETMRNTVRGEAAVTLFFARNTIFGIDPQSIRRRIPRSYAINMAALEMILTHAEAAGTRVIVYAAPLRSDIAPPYDLAEYAAFKAEAAALAARHGAEFADFDTLVPGELYGTKAATTLGGAAELDFMHFRASGHELLAAAMLLRIEDLLR